MKPITLNSAKDEAIGAVSASLGVVGGSVLMKMASGKINPWLVSLIGLTAGYGIRLAAENEMLKDIGTGLLIAGTLDAARKGLDAMGVDIPGLNDNIPTLSGPYYATPVIAPPIVTSPNQMPLVTGPTPVVIGPNQMPLVTGPLPGVIGSNQMPPSQGPALSPIDTSKILVPVSPYAPKPKSTPVPRPNLTAKVTRPAPAASLDSLIR